MSSKIVNLNKMTMHRRPTYETLVKDSILEPKDRIALPDRLATQLRNTQQLSMWDDPAFLNLEDEQQKIMQNQIRQGELLKISQTPLGKGLPTSTPPQQISSMKVQKALSEGSKPKDTASLGPISKITPGAASSPNKPAETFVISDAEDHLLEKQKEIEEDLETARLLAEEKKEEARKQAEESLKTKTVIDEYIEDLYNALEKQQTKTKTKKAVIGPITTTPFIPATSTAIAASASAASASAASQEDTPEISRPIPAKEKTKRGVGRPSKEQISPELSRPRSVSRPPPSRQAEGESTAEPSVPLRMNKVITDLKNAIGDIHGRVSEEDIKFFNILITQLNKKDLSVSKITQYNTELKDLWKKVYMPPTKPKT